MGSRRKRSDRIKKRFPCALFVDEMRHSGFVIDVSTTGVFVQTSASIMPNSRVEIEMRLPGVPEPVRSRARVARRKVVPPRLTSVAQPGVGLALKNAPKAFLAFLSEQSKDGAA